MDSVKLDLHALPLETLQQITGYLNRPSLHAFGLTSAICYRATIPLIFRHIHLTISSRETLQSNVGILVKTLSRTESARHVRCISIRGKKSNRNCTNNRDSWSWNEFRVSDASRVEGYKSDSTDRHSWFDRTGLDEILVDEEPLADAPHVVYDEPVIAKSSEEDLAWAPFVALIKTLPHITKLVYDCRNQFPPSLLDALHDHHPQCKLYHLTFKLRTLLWGTPYPYEMALATSPCLYSIKVACGERDSEGDDDFNQEAIMELVAGLAPNLKEVVVVNLRPQNSWRYFRRPREPWRGLPGFVPDRSIGSLISLSLVGNVDRRSPALIQAWARHTDFGRLRHLAIGGGYGCESSGINDEVMEWVTQNCSFPRLESLRIRMSRDDYNFARPNYANNAVALLKGFKPLEQLSVSGPLEPKILDAILHQHGQKLKRLDLRPIESEWIPDKKHVLQIHSHCPVLQELAIPVRRTKSDIFEVEMYKIFGKMERLKSLFLILDCSGRRVTRDSNSRDNSSFDAADRETWISEDLMQKSHEREMLVNCAVDEALAKSIWETICRNKAGQKLESLKLWTTGADQWGQSGGYFAGSIVSNLSRSWLIERVARDDKDIINIRELGQKAREARDESLTRDSERYAEYCRREDDTVMELGEAMEKMAGTEIFRCIWPCKNGKDWREDWSSFPLPI